MLKIEEPKKATDDNQPSTRLNTLAKQAILALPFRSYFLLAVTSGALTVVLWAAWLNGYLVFAEQGLSPVVWHIHEMLFGFAATVAMGFLLTAVQNWTGKASLSGLPLFAFIVLWLVARGLFIANQEAFIYLALALQTLWWLGGIATFTYLVVSKVNRRNYIFIPVLVALMSLNIALVLLDLQAEYQLANHIARTAVLTFCLLIGILGGRVIPFFTLSGTGLTTIDVPKSLTPLLMVVSVCAVGIFLLEGLIELPFTPGIFLILAGVLHLFRQSFWRCTVTVKIPLLWSLHLAYGALALGLILLGFSYWSVQPLGVYVAFSDAIHLITIAAMGLMIFSMMARVSLGHTGRALIPHAYVVWVFVFIFMSALARVILPSIQQALAGWNISAMFWLLASILFLRVYFPILINKRVTTAFNK